uniref:Uncharacterized protein n=1 Tax=Zea mays TaxID=4577 RepID=A0A804MY50_MAIZE
MELSSLTTTSSPAAPAGTTAGAARAARTWSRTRAAMPSSPACRRATSASLGVPRTGSHSNSQRSSHPPAAAGWWCGVVCKYKPARTDVSGRLGVR